MDDIVQPFRLHNSQQRNLRVTKEPYTGEDVLAIRFPPEEYPDGVQEVCFPVMELLYVLLQPQFKEYERTVNERMKHRIQAWNLLYPGESYPSGDDRGENNEQ